MRRVWTKGVINISKSKDRQHNDQMKKGKRTDNTMTKWKRAKGQTTQWPNEKGQKDRQHNDQMKKYTRTNNDLQYTTKKAKDRTTRAQLNPRMESGAPDTG
jgi:hypothetical protein